MSKNRISKIIIEEYANINTEVSRYLWESRKSKARKCRNKLLDQGYDSTTVDRKIIKEFVSLATGIGQRGIGLGGAEFFDFGSDNILGDGTSGIRTALEQSALETIIKKIGLDPNAGMGIEVKNALERVLAKYSDDELQEMFTSADGCHDTAYEISKETLAILEESQKERFLRIATQSIFGELGVDFQTSKIGKPIYQNFQEKFSSSFDGLINEESLAKTLADEICSSFSMDSMLASASDQIGSEVGEVFDEFTNIFSDLGSNFSS